MNITLSADRAVVRRTRDYAARHGTTMNQMIRGFIEKIAGGEAGEHAAEEFERLALENAGCSSKNYRFDRDEAHLRK